MARSNSRSTRTTRTARSSTPRTTRSTRTVSPKTNTETRRATDRRTLKYFNFQYNRDDVSHARGANSVTITDRSSSGDTISLSLQEARSLYDFLANHIRSR
jgi:pyrroloquinoline quinone (PQQ) biosynthesis protein C